MQEEGRSLCGGIGHLARGRPDVMIDHALVAQCMARMTYEARNHCFEILRFANAVPMRLEYPSTVLGPDRKRATPSLYREPIRPYDVEIDYDLWAVGDMGMKKHSVENAKPMGGFAIMYGAGLLEAKSYRFHTVVTDSTSGETLVASRAGNRVVVYRRLLRFWGKPPLGPTPLFTDNDGTWYVARDGTGTTRMNYIINHVRMLQELETSLETRAFQIDRALNPADVLASWRDPATRTRHYALLMGDPVRARKLWRESSAFKQWKPATLVPVPVKPPAVNQLAATGVSSVTPPAGPSESEA
jgi:hypothetical protein